MSVAALARALELRVDSLRPLLFWGLLPKGCIARIGSRYTVIRIDDDQLQACRAAITIEKVISRLPALQRPRELHLVIDELATRWDLNRRSRRRDAQRTIAGPADDEGHAFGLYSDRAAELSESSANREQIGAAWKALVLQRPTEELATVFVLQCAIEDWWHAETLKRGRLGSDAAPSRLELADFLGVSERMLRREPFTDAVWKLALAGVVPELPRKRAPEPSEAEDEAWKPITEVIADSGGQDERESDSASETCEPEPMVAQCTTDDLRLRPKRRREKARKFYLNEARWEAFSYCRGGSDETPPRPETGEMLMIAFAGSTSRTAPVKRPRRQRASASVMDPATTDRWTSAVCIASYTVQRDGTAIMEVDGRRPRRAPSPAHARAQIVGLLAAANDRLRVWNLHELKRAEMIRY